MRVPGSMPIPDALDKIVNIAHVRLNDASRAYYVLLGNGDLSLGIHRHYGWPYDAEGAAPREIAGALLRGRLGAMPYRLKLPDAVIHWCEAWGAGTVSDTLEERLGAGSLHGQSPSYGKPSVVVMLTKTTAFYFGAMDPSPEGIANGIVTHFYTITGKP